MRKIAIVAAGLALMAGVGVWAAQDGMGGQDEKGGEMQMPKPTKEHEWLQQLVGEWSSKGEAAMPDGTKMEIDGTETVRSIGGFWTVHENKAEMMGQPFTGILTIGYSTAKKTYVGTWIDSMGDHMWTYEGSLKGNTLTLKTEGPSPMDPKKTCKFEESIEMKDKNTKIFTSKIEMDGKWSTMMTITSTRK